MSLTQPQLKRIVASQQDFQLALSAATFLTECDPEKQYDIVKLREFKCYETTMVVSYARPFSSAKGRFRAFRPDLVGFDLAVDALKLHDDLVRFRNKVFAHTSEDMVRLRSYTFPSEIPMPDESKFNFWHSVHDEGIYFLGAKLSAVQEHIRRLKWHISDTLFRIAQAEPNSLSFLHEADSPYEREDNRG